jgi:serine phosphatase RsbU (regulator of sigma subunit)
MPTNSSEKSKGLLKRANGEIIELKSSKKSIRDIAKEEFELFEIEVSPNNKLIIYSDELINEFNRKKNKKFAKNRLKELIASIPSSNNASDITNILKYNFTYLKGKSIQTNDVLFIVIDF